jgi:hypothetical protein
MGKSTTWNGMNTPKSSKANKVSLNKAEREKELAEADAQKKERNEERRARFAKLTAEDAKNFVFHKITLDDLEKGGDLKPYDPSKDDGDYMRRAVDETESLDDTPEWASGLNAEKREALHIINDLVELTETAKMVGVLKSDGGVR